MDKKHKCNYCGALLSNTDSVFIHINRYDDKGRRTKSLWMCCKCWDNTTHAVKVTSDDIKRRKCHE